MIKIKVKKKIFQLLFLDYVFHTILSICKKCYLLCILNYKAMTGDSDGSDV